MKIFALILSLFALWLPLGQAAMGEHARMLRMLDKKFKECETFYLQAGSVLTICTKQGFEAAFLGRGAANDPVPEIVVLKDERDVRYTLSFQEGKDNVTDLRNFLFKHGARRLRG